MSNYNDYQQRVNELKTGFVSAIKNNFSDKQHAKFITKALNYAEESHSNQFRKSGEPYIIHPICTAKKLLDWQMDYETVAAGLLHDVIEDTAVTHSDLLLLFGYTIADIVQTVSKVTRYSKRKRHDTIQNQSDNMYVIQVFLSMSKDLRAIVVKLADRMHNMETINYLSLEKQQSITRETLDIYAPIAGRMGMYNIKTQLEDMCFKILDSHSYSLIYKLVKKLENDVKNTWDRVRNQVKTMLDVEDIKHQIEYRIKGIYSIWKKMEKGYLPENIHDIFAMRIIVDDELECYKVLGLIHLNFIYISNAFKDYISSPRWNLYRSIHTTVIVNRFLIEFQIRTTEMHQVSQMGLAAHWKYKESDDYINISKKMIDEVLQGRQPSIEIIKEISKSDLFDVFVSNDNQFYVCVSKTTILDLAFRYDPSQFEYLASCFRNGAMVTFDTRVKKGDVVHFNYATVTKIQQSWAESTQNMNLINHINDIFRKRSSVNKHTVDNFLQIIKKHLKLQEISESNYVKRLTYLGYKNLKDFLDDSPKWDVDKNEFYNFFSSAEKIWKPAARILKKILAKKIFLDTYFLPPTGVFPDKLVITECCSKFPDTHLVGILKNNILYIHRYDCLRANTKKGKWVVVEWDKKALQKDPRQFKVKLKIFGKMTETVTNQIIQTMLQQKVLILKVDIQKKLDNNNFKGDLIIRINDNNQLKRLIEDLKIKGFVKDVEII